jgi:predicted enzyme related to lactoylglutathione lyase
MDQRVDGGEGVRELRLVVTADDYDEAIAFYRDALGLPELADFSSEDGRVRLFDAGRATLEIADARQAGFIDRIEVGRRVAGHIRIAFEVEDSRRTMARLASAGAIIIAGPVETPWGSTNVRIDAPADLQLTLFSGPSDVAAG